VLGGNSFLRCTSSPFSPVAFNFLFPFRLVEKQETPPRCEESNHPTHPLSPPRFTPTLCIATPPSHFPSWRRTTVSVSARTVPKRMVMALLPREPIPLLYLRELRTPFPGQVRRYSPPPVTFFICLCKESLSLRFSSCVPAVYLNSFSPVEKFPSFIFASVCRPCLHSRRFLSFIPHQLTYYVVRFFALLSPLPASFSFLSTPTLPLTSKYRHEGRNFPLSCEMLHFDE